MTKISYSIEEIKALNSSEFFSSEYQAKLDGIINVINDLNQRSQKTINSLRTQHFEPRRGRGRPMRGNAGKEKQLAPAIRSQQRDSPILSQVPNEEIHEFLPTQASLFYNGPAFQARHPPQNSHAPQQPQITQPAQPTQTQSLSIDYFEGLKRDDIHSPYIEKDTVSFARWKGSWTNPIDDYDSSSVHHQRRVSNNNRNKQKEEQKRDDVESPNKIVPHNIVAPQVSRGWNTDIISENHSVLQAVSPFFSSPTPDIDNAVSLPSTTSWKKEALSPPPFSVLMTQKNPEPQEDEIDFWGDSQVNTNPNPQPQPPRKTWAKPKPANNVARLDEIIRDNENAKRQTQHQNQTHGKKWQKKQHKAL